MGVKKYLLDLSISPYDVKVISNKQYSWAITLLTAGILVVSAAGRVDPPPFPTIFFWIALLAAIALLPVSLGFGSEVTMGTPIHLALAIVYRNQPWVPMMIAGVAAFDLREIRRQIPLHRAFFNRSQVMLSVGASAGILSMFEGRIFSFPYGLILIVGASAAHFLTNLGLVGLSISTDSRIPLDRAIRGMLPEPVAGFLLSYVLMSGLGAATAAVYRLPNGGAWAVAALLIPLMFARLSILGARAQQELSERVREQQRALLEATERMFKERELERHRIAEEIHDTSLQLLAAAAYGLGNANEWLNAEERIKAREAIATSRDAIEDAMKALRGSLVDLRKSAVEEGGLLETVRNFAEQMSLLWGTEIQTNGRVDVEPPIPVALAGFQILQEGLTNALKHAQGTPITVTIGNQNGMIHLTVEDNGPGFDPEQEVGTDHVGMRLMRERAARVGGSIVLDTAPGRGTKLEAILPGGVEQ